MDEFGSGGIEHVRDVLDAIGSGPQSLLHRLNFIIILRNIIKRKMQVSKNGRKEEDWV